MCAVYMCAFVWLMGTIQVVGDSEILAETVKSGWLSLRYGVCVRACVRVCVCVCLCAVLCVCTCMNLWGWWYNRTAFLFLGAMACITHGILTHNTYIHIYIHTYINTHTYMHTYMHKQRGLPANWVHGKYASWNSDT